LPEVSVFKQHAAFKQQSGSRKTVSGRGENHLPFIQDLFSGLGMLPGIYGNRVRVDLVEREFRADSVLPERR
jgi:hypothetical protein